MLPPRIILAKWLLDNKQGSNARVQIELAAAAEPDDPSVFLFNGLIAELEGRHVDARLNCETALKLADTIKDADQKKDIQREAHIGLSRCAEAMNQWEAARAHLEKWLELDPANGMAHMAYGRALFKTGKPEKAAYDQLVEAAKLQAAADKKAGRDEPSLEMAEISMARLWGARDSKNAAEAKENALKAEEWFGKATQAAKETKDKARVQLAYAEWLLNTAEGKEDKLKEALKHAEHARDLFPGLSASRRVYGHILRALGDYGAAERIFEALHQDDLTDVDAANQLVLVLVESRQASNVKRAFQLAQVNARQYPRSPEILAALGWVCYRVKNLDEAERYLRLSVSSGPATQDTLYYLATVLSVAPPSTSGSQAKRLAEARRRSRSGYRKPSESSGGSQRVIHAPQGSPGAAGRAEEKPVQGCSWKE